MNRGARIALAILVCATAGVNSGCIMTPCGKTPAIVKPERVPADAPRVVRSRNLTYRALGVMERAWPRRKAEAEDLDSSAFRRAGVRMGVLTADASSEMSGRSKTDVSLSVECQCRVDWSLDLLRVFTVTLAPCPRHNDWIYDFTVRSKNGKTAQYRFEDGWETYCGLATLFALPWKWFTDDDAADRILENVYLNLFAAMKRDGFFDQTTVRQTLVVKPEMPVSKMIAPNVSQPVGVAKADSDDRRNDLESLKSAGIISDEEYKREIEKLKKEMK